MLPARQSKNGPARTPRFDRRTSVANARGAAHISADLRAFLCRLEMSRSRVRGILVTAALCVGSYASHAVPAPVPPEQSTERVDVTGQRSKYPSFAFLADSHRFALYGVAENRGVAERGASDEGGLLTSMVVFEDDRYLGTLNPIVALGYPTCLAQPGGTLLLAERLRSLTSDRGDPLARETPDERRRLARCFVHRRQDCRRWSKRFRRLSRTRTRPPRLSQPRRRSRLNHHLKRRPMTRMQRYPPQLQHRSAARWRQRVSWRVRR